MIEIYLTGFLVHFLFALVELTDMKDTKNIKGNIEFIEWGYVLFTCLFTSLIWFVFIVVHIVQIRINSKTYKTVAEFERGYKGAIKGIAEGKDPAELRIQAKTDIVRDDFYKGWVKACEENL